MNLKSYLYVTYEYKRDYGAMCNLLILLMRPARIELATFGFVVVCNILTIFSRSPPVPYPFLIYKHFYSNVFRELMGDYAMSTVQKLYKTRC